MRTPWAALLFVVACQNNTIELETEPSSMDDSTTVVNDPTTTGSPGGPETMLLAINTVWSDTEFIQALMTSMPGNGATDITIQFLSLDVGSNTSPRQPVGPVYSYPAVPVDASGGFVLDAGMITIPAEANPINGLEIATTLVLIARPEGAPLCGDVTGSVSVPVVAQFDGSTHAMTSIPGPSELPTNVVASCP